FSVYFASECERTRKCGVAFTVQPAGSFSFARWNWLSSVLFRRSARSFGVSDFQASRSDAVTGSVDLLLPPPVALPLDDPSVDALRLTSLNDWRDAVKIGRNLS